MTCTFANRKRAQLTIVKNAVPDSPQDFDFTAGGGLSPGSFSLDDDADGTPLEHTHVRQRGAGQRLLAGGDGSRRLATAFSHL